MLEPPDRRTPERSCAACRTKRRKSELMRFARISSGSVVFDPSGSAPGRGAWVCTTEECLERALAKGGLARTLRTTLGREAQSRLKTLAVEYLSRREM